MHEFVVIEKLACPHNDISGIRKHRPYSLRGRYATAINQSINIRLLRHDKMQGNKQTDKQEKQELNG